MQYTTPNTPRNTPRFIRIAIRAYVRGWLPLGVVAWLLQRTPAGPASRRAVK